MKFASASTWTCAAVRGGRSKFFLTPFLSLYDFWGDSGRLGEIGERHISRSPSQTLNLRLLEIGSAAEVDSLIYFTGGESPGAIDDHNKYACDEPGFGRDSSYVGGWGMPGQFHQAAYAAIKQTEEFLRWAQSNMSEPCRRYLLIHP